MGIINDLVCKVTMNSNHSEAAGTQPFFDPAVQPSTLFVGYLCTGIRYAWRGVLDVRSAASKRKTRRSSNG